MKYKHESISKYMSESGGFSTEVVRIEVNENVLYSVTDSNGNHLGYFDNECDAEAIAEDSVLWKIWKITRRIYLHGVRVVSETIRTRRRKIEKHMRIW